MVCGGWWQQSPSWAGGRSLATALEAMAVIVLLVLAQTQNSCGGGGSK